MEEKLYTLVSTGLLALIALLLLVVVSGIARVERALKRRTGEPGDPIAVESTPTVDGAVASALAGPAPAEPEAAEGDAPFEQDGRWWYRSGGELLVYDEQTESWVLPSTTTPDTESWVVPSPTTPDPEPEPHPLDEARGWDTTPQEETAPQEVTTPEEATAAPIPEPVAEPEPITGPAVEEEAAQEQPASAPAGEGTHWKCPACGVINGSTATSCRMCFAARP